MAWIASLAGAGMSAYSGKKSGDAASSAEERQRESALADLDFRKNIYAEERGFQQPIRDYLKKEALSGMPLDYGEQKGNIERGTAEANRAALGINYGMGMANSGQAVNAPLFTSLAGSQAKARAWAEGQKARRGLALQAMGYGRPLEAAEGVSRASGNMGNIYGNLMNTYNQAAAQSYGNAAQGIYGLGQYLETRNQSSENVPQAASVKTGYNNPVEIPESRSYSASDDLTARPQTYNWR